MTVQHKGMMEERNCASPEGIEGVHVMGSDKRAPCTCLMTNPPVYFPLMVLCCRVCLRTQGSHMLHPSPLMKCPSLADGREGTCADRLCSDNKT